MKHLISLSACAAFPCIGFAADLTGTWKSEFDSQIGRQKYTYTLKQEGHKLTGKANSEVNDQKREAQLSEGKVDGDKVSFVEMLDFNGNDIRITYKGTIVSNEMKLTREVGTFATEEIVLKRDRAAQPAVGAGQRGGRGGFGGPIVLGPEIKRPFRIRRKASTKGARKSPTARLNWSNMLRSPLATSARPAFILRLVIGPRNNIQSCISCTGSAGTKRNGTAAVTRRSFWTT